MQRTTPQPSCSVYNTRPTPKAQGPLWETGWKDEEPEGLEIRFKLATTRNKREATTMKPQQYNCLSSLKTWAITTPIDMLPWKGGTSQRPTCEEINDSRGKISPHGDEPLTDHLMLSGQPWKHTHIQVTLNGLSRLCLHVYTSITCVMITEIEAIHSKEREGEVGEELKEKERNDAIILQFLKICKQKF